MSKSSSAHAAAFATLVPLGRERDRECVGCHVVGFEQPGGWTLADPRPHVENVGCENSCRLKAAIALKYIFE